MPDQNTIDAAIQAQMQLGNGAQPPSQPNTTTGANKNPPVITPIEILSAILPIGAAVSPFLGPRGANISFALSQAANAGLGVGNLIRRRQSAQLKAAKDEEEAAAKAAQRRVLGDIVGGQLGDQVASGPPELRSAVAQSLASDIAGARKDFVGGPSGAPVQPSAVGTPPPSPQIPQSFEFFQPPQPEFGVPPSGGIPPEVQRFNDRSIPTINPFIKRINMGISDRGNERLASNKIVEDPNSGFVSTVTDLEALRRGRQQDSESFRRAAGQPANQRGTPPPPVQPAPGQPTPLQPTPDVSQANVLNRATGRMVTPEEDARITRENQEDQQGIPLDTGGPITESTEVFPSPSDLRELPPTPNTFAPLTSKVLGKTPEGRTIYEAADGRPSSERSTTFQVDGQWYNYPTIFNGKEVSVDQALDTFKAHRGVDPETGITSQPFASQPEAEAAASERSESIQTPREQQEGILPNTPVPGGTLDPAASEGQAIGRRPEDAIVSDAGGVVSPTDIPQAAPVQQTQEPGFGKPVAFQRLPTAEFNQLPPEQRLEHRQIARAHAATETKRAEAQIEAEKAIALIPHQKRAQTLQVANQAASKVLNDPAATLQQVAEAIQGTGAGVPGRQEALRKLPVLTAQATQEEMAQRARTGIYGPDPAGIQGAQSVNANHGNALLSRFSRVPFGFDQTQPLQSAGEISHSQIEEFVNASHAIQDELPSKVMVNAFMVNPSLADAAAQYIGLGQVDPGVTKNVSRALGIYGSKVASNTIAEQLRAMYGGKNSDREASASSLLLLGQVEDGSEYGKVAGRQIRLLRASLAKESAGRGRTNITVNTGDVQDGGPAATREAMGSILAGQALFRGTARVRANIREFGLTSAGGPIAAWKSLSSYATNTLNSIIADPQRLADKDSEFANLSNAEYLRAAYGYGAEPGVPAIATANAFLTFHVARILDPVGQISEAAREKAVAIVGGAGVLSNVQDVIIKLDEIDAFAMEQMTNGRAGIFSRVVDPEYVPLELFESLVQQGVAQWNLDGRMPDSRQMVENSLLAPAQEEFDLPGVIVSPTNILKILEEVRLRTGAP